MPAVSLSRSPQSVQAFGRKKNAIAVSYCKKGRGLIKINGSPIELVEPVLLRYKVFEPILLLGRERFSIMDLRIRVKGGGYTSQIYGARYPGSCGGHPGFLRATFSGQAAAQQHSLTLGNFSRCSSPHRARALSGGCYGPCGSGAAG
jgi:hypothetical protein